MEIKSLTTRIEALFTANFNRAILLLFLLQCSFFASSAEYFTPSSDGFYLRVTMEDDSTKTVGVRNKLFFANGHIQLRLYGDVSPDILANEHHGYRAKLYREIGNILDNIFPPFFLLQDRSVLKDAILTAANFDKNKLSFTDVVFDKFDVEVSKEAMVLPRPLPLMAEVLGSFEKSAVSVRLAISFTEKVEDSEEQALRMHLPLIEGTLMSLFKRLEEEGDTVAFTLPRMLASKGITRIENSLSVGFRERIKDFAVLPESKQRAIRVKIIDITYSD